MDVGQTTVRDPARRDTVNIGTPPNSYDRNWFSRAFDRLGIELRNRYTQNQDLIVDGNRLVLVSPNKTRYKLTVNDAGVLSTTAL